MLQNSQMVSSGVLYIPKSDISLVFAEKKNLPFHLKIDRDTHIKLVDRLEALSRIIKS